MAFGEGRFWSGGVLERFWERDVGEVGRADSKAGCAESPAPLDAALPLAVKALTSLNLLF